MEPLDPLDQMLRGPASAPWHERAREQALRRWPWMVALGFIVAVGGVVVAVGSSSPAAIELPLASPESPGAAGAAGAAAGSASSASSGSPSGGQGDTSTTTVSGLVHFVVHVVGAVNAPGLTSLPINSRMSDTVAAAGELRPDADGDRLNLAAPLADGVRLFVPIVGQTDPPPAVVVSGGSSGAAASPEQGGPVDINSASATELDVLPGVGPSTAAAIVAYRTEHGRFVSIDELQEVRGIGPAKFEALAAMVTVGP